jgi:uncharacterized NAD(P)/FAD-binding protein YdhS
MKSDRRVPVAIVGGGASGTILAAQLARRGIASALVDGSGRAGRGLAYSTTEPAHLLNVRAEGMSAWADDPQHFARRFESEGGDARGFAQRLLFGRYLREMLDEAVSSGHVQVVDASATAAERQDKGWTIRLDNGSALDAAAAVLCTGNQEPQALRAFASAGSRFIANPWGRAAQDAVRELAACDGDALLVGTGLTMVDLALSLDAAGHKGRILALSRRGLIPRGHADYQPAPVEADEAPQASVRTLLRWLRSRSAQVGWRAAIDSLRPHSHHLWQSLSPDEQHRFLRHARPYWDVHRHRIAPEVAATVARMIAEERLQIAAGRIVSAVAAEARIKVELRRRGRRESERRNFAYVFNCTGPLHSMADTRDPLLRSLLDAGNVRPDHLGIGIAIDHKCRAAERLWALGPLSKGRYWEIIAVPDIREQAAAVADDIALELQQ